MNERGGGNSTEICEEIWHKKEKKSITLKIQSYPPKMIMHKNGKNQKNAWCP